MKSEAEHADVKNKLLLELLESEHKKNEELKLLLLRTRQELTEVKEMYELQKQRTLSSQFLTNTINDQKTIAKLASQIDLWKNRYETLKKVKAKCNDENEKAPELKGQVFLLCV